MPRRIVSFRFVLAGWHPHPQHRQDLGEARAGRPYHRGHREPPGKYSSTVC